MIRTTRERLVQQAWWRYDPEMTVVKAKRHWEPWLDKPVYTSTELPMDPVTPSSDISETPDINNEESIDETMIDSLDIEESNTISRNVQFRHNLQYQIQ